MMVAGVSFACCERSLTTGRAGGGQLLPAFFLEGTEMIEVPVIGGPFHGMAADIDADTPDGGCRVKSASWVTEIDGVRQERNGMATYILRTRDGVRGYFYESFEDFRI